MSTLLEQASLVMIPSGYKEDIVYSQIPTSGAGDLSFTRASNGTRVNSAGLVEVCPWNLLQQSNTFNVTWVSGGPGGTVTSGQTDPNGGSNAWLLSKLGQTGRIEQTINVGGVQTFFIYAKKNTSDFILINVYDGTTSHECWFNLSTGVVGTQNASTGAIESVGNGWYKCSVTSTNLFASGIIQLYQSENNGVVTGTTGSIYIFNSQLNIGSTAKPYFPTTDRLNVPRLTYQNGGGGCPSLLLEKQSTNYCTQSQTFSAWTGDATVTPNATTSPDGTQNATVLTEQTGFGYGRIYQGTAATSSTKTLSVYAKYKTGGRSWMKIDNGPTAWFNIETGTLGNISAGTASIESVGNGWYRCSVSLSASVTGVYFIGATTGNGVDGYTGDGRDAFYIWGAQMEESSYATSYIPTTSSSATRVADSCITSGLSAVLPQTAGTLFWDIEYTSGTTSTMLMHNTGISDYGFVQVGSNGIVEGGIYESGTMVDRLAKATAITTGRHKMAFAYETNSFALYVDGSLADSGTSGSTASISMNTLSLNWNSTTDFTKVNQAVLFPTRLTNSELASLTTI